MSKLRIMLVDDHTVLRAGLKLLINKQSDMEVVADTGDAREVLRQVDALQPDVIVFDLSLPSGPSLPLIAKLTSQNAECKVLLLTMHDEPAYVRAALSSGATGYVVKTVGESELLQAIRSVGRGTTVIDLDDEALTQSVFQSSPGGSQAVPAICLSAREVEVLKLLGQGHSSQSISARLELSPKTVATYRARIAEKLGLKTTADYVRYVVDTGLNNSADTPSPRPGQGAGPD